MTHHRRRRLLLERDIKACSQHRNLDLVLERTIVGIARDHVHLLAEVGHELLNLAQLLSLERILAIGIIVDVNQNLARTIDVTVLQQRRLQSILDGLGHTVLALAISAADDGNTTIAQRGVDVHKVDVHLALGGDELADRACSSRECVIGLAKGVVEVQVGIDVNQALIVDDEQCVNIFAHLVGTG